jgi:4-hydroxy-2-oxoheptanedioate aldolase
MKKTPLIGVCVMYPSPGVVERIGPDWDWVWIDGQHGQIGTYTEMLSMVRACNFIGKKAFVRVAGHELGPISVALDMAADGVIVPQVECAEDARRLVRAAKFPPLGERSYGARRSIDLGGRLFIETANAATELICQIESPGAVERADEIASVPGVDGLFLGPDDYMLRKGFSMDHPRGLDSLGDALEKVAGACSNHGKKGMAVGVGEGIAERCVELGYDYIVGGVDVGFLAGASKTASAGLRKLFEAPLAGPDEKKSFY